MSSRRQFLFVLAAVPFLALPSALPPPKLIWRGWYEDDAAAVLHGAWYIHIPNSKYMIRSIATVEEHYPEAVREHFKENARLVAVDLWYGPWPTYV